MPLDISKYIVNLRQHPEIGNYLGEALQQIQDAINTTARHAAVDATGPLEPPPPIQRLNVKVSADGHVQATIDDHSNVQRGVRYFVESSTDKSFRQPHVLPLSTSRFLPPTLFPAKDDNGQPQVFYFRAYSQYPGSKPSPFVHFGGSSPTPVAPGGTTQITLLPSTGSGTAPNDGQRGHSGFGRDLFRKL
jgi:hypothetical protein